MTTQPTRYEALTACLTRAGSQSAMARDLGLAQSTVWRWVEQTKQMPAEYVLKAEALYGVSRHHLRPDIYPRELLTDQHVEDRFCGIDLRIPDPSSRTSGRKAA